MPRITNHRRGGLTDDNIIVFMDDVIANSSEICYPSKLVNNPDGPDVYASVPKDYRRADVTARHHYAATFYDKDVM